MATDIIGRELAVDDHVVYYNNIYRILSSTKNNVGMILLKKANTTKPVVQLAKYVALLPKDDVLMWLLKRDAK